MEEVVASLLQRLTRPRSKLMAPYFGGIEVLTELESLLRMIQAVLPDAQWSMQDGYPIPHHNPVTEWHTGLDAAFRQLWHLFDYSFDEAEKMPQAKLISFKTDERLMVQREVKAIVEGFREYIRVSSLWECPVADENNRNQGSEKHVCQKDILGAEDGWKRIAHLLRDQDDRSTEALDTRVIVIVGVGGVGKTALAKRVFSELHTEQQYDLRAWASLPVITTPKQVIPVILRAIKGYDCRHHDLSLEQLSHLLREVISHRKYLVILDDVQNVVDQDGWRQVKLLLSGGITGSVVLVTTRSAQVAQTMANFVYDLKGLPRRDAWNLFKRQLAIDDMDLSQTMMEIAQEIPFLCCGLPLSIKTLAAILKSNFTEQGWMLKYHDFTVGHNDDFLMSILSRSYNDLPPHLRMCFDYCSLFPTDYEIDKQSLIHYWMAQGFVRSLPSTQSQSPEEIGHDIFTELLGKFLFQERISDGIGYNFQPTMHELSRQCAGNKYLMMTDEMTMNISETVEHLSFVVGPLWKAPSWLLGANNFKSLLFLPSNSLEFITELNLDAIFRRLTNLRTLNLAMVKCDSLPSSLKEMKQLRFLSLGISTKSLPAAVTMLHHLETLDLRACHQLRKLPDGFDRLTNLRHLHIKNKLLDMPPHFDKLTSLQTLDSFTVGENNGLAALASLNSLAGSLKIHYEKCHGEVTLPQKTGILKDTKLIDLSLTWSLSSGETDAYSVLECLHPPPSLQSLAIKGWKGVSLPKWGLEKAYCFLPNLVSVHIMDCSRCQHLPALSRFPHLKSLQLWNLKVLEYIESEVSRAPYFPSLLCLELYNLRELKGWSTMEGNEDQDRQQCFPLLSCLRISGCPTLMSMPLAPRLETIEAEDIHVNLLKHLLFPQESANLSTLKKLHIVSIRELDSSFHLNLLPGIESLTIRRCHQLIHMTADSQVPSLSHLEIESNNRLQYMSSALQHMSNLKELLIKGCEVLVLGNNDGARQSHEAKIRSLPTGLGCLTMLQKLYIWKLYNLKALPEEIQHLSQLRLLDIRHCPQIKSLPEGLGGLVKLQQLRLHHLPNLKGALPEWIGNLIQLYLLDIQDCPNLTALAKSIQKLASLGTLRISGCPLLIERCRRPIGEYWPSIRHIRHVTITAD